MRYFIALFIGLILSACQMTSKTSATIYHLELAKLYDAYAQTSTIPAVSQEFSSRASAARTGRNLMPLVPNATTLRPSAFAPLNDARELLFDETEGQIKHTATREAANVFFYYDCWVMEETHWMVQHSTTCRDEFFSAIYQLQQAKNRLAYQKDEPYKLPASLTAEYPENAGKNTDGGPITDTRQNAQLPLSMQKAPLLLTGDAPAASAGAPAVKKEEYIIYHGFDMSSPLTASIGTIDDVAREAKAAPALRISIQGHTDTSGSDAYNLRLSQKRAEAVKEKLIERQVNAARMEALGFGETDLRETTADGIKNQENRRTEVYFLEN